MITKIESKTLLDKQAFLFDLDGCIYFGDKLADGTTQLLQLLHDKGKQIAVITNNSVENAHEIAIKLQHMGLHIPAESIFCATEYAGRTILDHYGRCVVKVIGSDSLQAAIRTTGHQLITYDDKQVPDVILMGRDTSFHYKKLQHITADLDRGADLVSTNLDLSHPGKNGLKVPETGALVISLEAMFAKKAFTIGKPAPHLFQYALQRLAIPLHKAVMFGDNLATDIVGGECMGMSTVWVKGKQSISLLNNAEKQPTWIFTSLQDVLHRLLTIK